MAIDVSDLREFYASPLGQVAARLIHRQVQSLWPDLRNQRLVGLGYALPYLEPYLNHAERTLALMPAQQGVLPWPAGQKSLSVLVDEGALPLPDQSVDNILLIHAIEHVHHVRPYLREIWRVLGSNGRLLIIAPNRRSFWARLDHTPFGQGQPYTMTQLRNLLKENMFTPTQETRGLYIFPSASRLLLTSNRLFESLGKHIFQKFSGVICIEAMKQIYVEPTLRSEKRVPIIARLVGT